MSEAFYFDCDAALAHANWREHTAWPRSLAETDRDNRLAWAEYWSLIKSLMGNDRECLLLAGGRIFAQCLALAEAASVVQAATRSGMEVLGGPRAVRFYRSARADAESPAMISSSAFKQPADPSFVMLRRWARSLALSPPKAWASALISPDAVALSHNDLMHGYAAAQGLGVGFLHGEEIFKAAQRNGTEPGTAVAPDLADRVSAIFLAGRTLADRYVQRFMAMARPLVANALQTAARDISGVRKIRKLPSQIWIGGGGYYPARLAAQEVRRRGGSVTGFEHGWGSASETVAEGLAFGELAFADSYVAYTPRSARMFRESRAEGINIREKPTRFLEGNGDPSMRKADKLRNGAVRPRHRLKVLYAPTITAGFRQMAPPLLPDPAYLNWQMQICEAMNGVPVNFVWRPHPEGYFRNRRHPLAGHAAHSDRPFEELAREADVFLFDFRQSTTFGHALCSDRPIVLLDFGLRPFDDETEDAIRKRCRVVDVAFDALNRPLLDVDHLKNAVLSSEEAGPDNQFFRSLLIGQA